MTLKMIEHRQKILLACSQIVLRVLRLCCHKRNMSRDESDRFEEYILKDDFKSARTRTEDSVSLFSGCVATNEISEFDESDRFEEYILKMTFKMIEH